MEKVGRLSKDFIEFETGLKGLDSVVVAVGVAAVVKEFVKALAVLLLFLFQVCDYSLWVEGFLLFFVGFLLGLVGFGRRGGLEGVLWFRDDL